MIRRLSTLVVLVCMASLVFGHRQAQAVLLAYESFDYALGDLNGKGPGELGFTGTWSGGLASYDVEAGNLAYPSGTNFTPEGNMARLTGGAGTIRQAMSASIDFSSAGTYYLSFQVRKNDNSSTGNEFLWVTLNNAGDASFKTAMGLGSTESMLLGNATAGFSSTVTDYYTTNETYLYLAKIVTNSGATPDQFYAKMIDANGTVPLTEPTWDLTHSIAVNGIANRLQIEIGSLSNHTVDAFRLGTTYLDVALGPAPPPPPAPEPSSVALLGLGLVGLAHARRQRRGASIA